MQTKILYEVYTKRAIHEDIDGLVLLDRDTNLKKMIPSARAWGGCVVRVKAEILSTDPLTRRVIEYTIAFIHKPARPRNEERDSITRKTLMGKIHRGGYRR